MKNKIQLVFFFLIISIVSGFSQEQKKLVHSMTHRKYGLKEGLNQSQVFYSFQDSYGYIWFVTHVDVSRFDGKEFRTFPRSELGSGALVKHVNQYKDAIVFVSRDCISFMSPDEQIEKYPMPGDYKTDRGWWGTFVVNDNYLYLFNCYEKEEDHTNNYTLFRFDLEQKKFEKVKDSLSYGAGYVVDGRLILWMSGEGSNKLLTLSDNNDLISIPFAGLAFKDNRDYYITQSISPGELFFSSAGRDKEEQIIYSGKFIGDTLHFTVLSEINFHTGSRIQRIDESRAFIGWNENYILDNGRLLPFPVNTLLVNYVMTDRDGNLWLSTEEGVINCHRLWFDSYKLGIKHNDNIWDVCKDRLDNVWFSTYGSGIWKADKNGHLTKAGLSGKGKKVTLDYGYMGRAEDRLGRVYLASDEGIALADPSKGNTEKLDFFNTGTSLSVFYDTLTRCVYAGGFDRVKEGEFTTLCKINERLETETYRLGAKHIISICRDANRKLRIGTFRGEYVFDEKNGVFVEDTVKRPYAGVVSMDSDSRGYLWKGTTEGVYAEDRTGKMIRITNEKNMISFITCYRDKYIIWGTKDRLFILDLPAFHRDSAAINIRMFDGYSGFDVMECGQNGIYTDNEGTVWVVDGDQVLRFLPDNLMRMPIDKAAPPYLAAIFNTDKNRDWHLVRNKDSLTFENKNNYLRFDLLQASITAPDKLTFRYRMKGYSDHWTKTNDRTIVFQNIPYGKYLFEVQASVDDENWSESTLSSPITVKRPFWLTFPGILLISAGVVLILLSIAYWVRKTSIRKQEEKRQIEQLKYRAVQSKFIPHFTGNVLNSISYLISKDPELAQQYIVDFAGFSRQTLLNSDKLYRTLEEELGYTEIYLRLEKLRFEDDLEYIIEVYSTIDQSLQIPMMSLQTFCENALKHGLRHKDAPGRIELNAVKEKNYVVLSVEDNGIGREKAGRYQTEGTRQGLAIVQQQLDLMNKTSNRKAFLSIIDLFHSDGSARGTRFELHIPILR